MVVLPSSLFSPPGPWVSGKNYNRPRILLPILYRTVIQFLPKAAIIILINLVPPVLSCVPFPHFPTWAPGPPGSDLISPLGQYR